MFGLFRGVWVDQLWESARIFIYSMFYICEVIVYCMMISYGPMNSQDLHVLFPESKFCFCTKGYAD